MSGKRKMTDDGEMVSKKPTETEMDENIEQWKMLLVNANERIAFLQQEIMAKEEEIRKKATMDIEKYRQITKLVELLASANKTVSSQQRHIAEKDKMILKKDEIIAARDTSLKSRDDQLERNKDVIDEMKEDGQLLEMRMELWISLIRTYENIFTDFASGVDKNICLENLCARKQAVLERQKELQPKNHPKDF